MTKSSMDKPLEEKRRAISSREKLVSIMLGLTLDIDDVRPSLLPSGT